MKTEPVSKRRKAGRAPLKIKQDDLAFRLDMIHERVNTQTSRIYERECGVTLRELRLLRFIGNEPGLTLSRIIERAHLEKTLASKAITALVRRGLVVRSIGLEDARQVNIELTDGGVDAVMKAEPIGRLADAAFRAALTASEREVFEGCLQKLAKSGDGFEARVARLNGASAANASNGAKPPPRRTSKAA